MREPFFSLTSGIKELFLVEIALPKHKMMNFNQETNQVDLQANLDLLKESREGTFHIIDNILTKNYSLLQSKNAKMGPY